MKKPSIKTWRRTLQIGVAVSFILIPLLNHFRINYFTGNFLCFNAAGLPLADPLAVLQIILKNYYLSGDLLVGAGIALGLAAILGTVFCSWVCPFGLLSELGLSLGRRVFPKTYKGLTIKSISFRIKMILFGLGLAGFLLFSTTPVLNQLSLPAWYSRIFQFYFEQRHISLAILFLFAILLVEFAARQRLWCRYICPQSFLLIAAKLVNPFRLKIGYQKDTCLCKKGQDPCHKACSLSLDPKTLSESLATECTNCGDCVVACKKMGQALGFQFGS
ncbi:MAG: 4Fe-4S binding protein [Pseudomonadota bacterium]